MKKFFALFCLLLLAVPLAIESGCGNEQAAASASDVVGTASINLNKQTAYHTDFDIQLKMDGDSSDRSLAKMLPLDFGVTGKMDMDISDKSNIKLKVADIDIQGLQDLMQNSGSSKVEGAVASGMFTTLVNGLEVQFVKDALYIKFGDSWYKL